MNCMRTSTMGNCRCTQRACQFMLMHAYNESMGQCQRTSPVGWTDQPAKALRLFPPKAGSRRPEVQNLTQPQVEEKDCEARPPHPSPLLRKEGRAQSFPSPRRWMPLVRNTVEKNTPGRVFLVSRDPFTHSTTCIGRMTRTNEPSSYSP